MAYSLATILAGNPPAQAPIQRHARSATGASVRSARSRNRAAAWQFDLAQWRAYRLSMARSDQDRAGIEADYAERSAAGPDFVSHRGGSFVEPHLHKITREDRARLLRAFDEVRAWSWRNKRAHGQAVSKLYKDILAALCGFALKFGRVFPTLDTIAAMACCCKQTVVNGLRWLKLWGFLDWDRRLKRTPSRLGSVVSQASNAYRIGLRGLANIGAAIFSRRPESNNTTPSPLHRVRLQLLAQEKLGAG